MYILAFACMFVYKYTAMSFNIVHQTYIKHNSSMYKHRSPIVLICILKNNLKQKNK